MTSSPQSPIPSEARGLGKNMRPDVVDSMAPRGSEGREQADSAMERLEQSLDVETDTKTE